MDFENCPNMNIAGTYIKGVKSGTKRFRPNCHSPGYADGVVLYLLRSDFFLFIGSWHRYELTVAAGTWSESGHNIFLNGVGSILFMDCKPYPSGPRKFERKLFVTNDSGMPVLSAESEYEGWSLLGYTGPFYFHGEHCFVNHGNNRLSGSWDDIEKWAVDFIIKNSFA